MEARGRVGTDIGVPTRHIEADIPLYIEADIPLGCGKQWLLWCQSPESGCAQCTPPSSHTGQERERQQRQHIVTTLSQILTHNY